MVRPTERSVEGTTGAGAGRADAAAYADGEEDAAHGLNRDLNF
jgi:hypothetical protein